MDEGAEKIAINPVPWFPESRELIKRAEQGGAEVLDWIEAEIKAGRLTLFDVRDKWTQIGIFTARWYRRYDGTKVLQIVHGVAIQEQDGFSFMLTIKDEVQKVARDCGCSAIEIHTRRRGMDRRLENHGYRFQETVFTLEV